MTQDKLKVLTKVKDASRHREQEIERSKRLLRESREQAKRTRAESIQIHREANRDLVAALREAQSTGISVEEILEAVDRSSQWLSRLESQMRAWDAEKQRA